MEQKYQVQGSIANWAFSAEEGSSHFPCRPWKHSHPRWGAVSCNSRSKDARPWHVILLTFLSQFLSQHKPLTPPLSSGPEHNGHSPLHVPPQAKATAAVRRQRWCSRQSNRIQNQSSTTAQFPFPELPDPALHSCTRHSPCQCTNFADYLPSAGLKQVGRLGVTCSFPSLTGFKQSKAAKVMP